MAARWHKLPRGVKIVEDRVRPPSPPKKRVRREPEPQVMAWGEDAAAIMEACNGPTSPPRSSQPQ